MKSYIFEVELEKEKDGRWSATIPALAGCYSWGYTKEEALESLKENARAWLEVLMEKGQPLPEETEKVKIIASPNVIVTL